MPSAEKHITFTEIHEIDVQIGIDHQIHRATMSQASHSEKDITWERRQKWAYQVVRGLSQLHAKGFVVGGLTSYAVPVIVDSTDSILFPFFKKKLATSGIRSNYYPPELLHCRSLPANMDEADRPDMTSKVDIFHLGLIL